MKLGDTGIAGMIDLNISYAVQNKYSTSGIVLKMKWVYVPKGLVHYETQ